MKTLGLIAGNGKFPLILSENARKRGVRVIAVALKEETDPGIEAVADKVYWLSLTQLGKLIKTFKKEGVEKAVMAGQVIKRRMYASDILKLDLTAARLWASLPDKRGDTILKAVADELSRNGIELVDSTVFMEDFLAKKGVLAGAALTDGEAADVEFGFEMAKLVAGRDIGQSVVVKDRSVVAVEAAEGTDACVLRAGGLCGGDFTLVKVSMKGHDMRFDVPVVGLTTLDTLKKAGAAVLAVEAGKTLILEMDELIAGANKAGIKIVGI